MPARGIHHVDLAVRKVERSLAFYLARLGPVGLHEAERYPSYRGTEEVVYLRFGDQYLGLRPADGGEHRYYEVGIEHLAFYVDSREEVDAAYQRCLEIGAQIHFPPEEDRDIEGPGLTCTRPATPRPAQTDGRAARLSRRSPDTSANRV